MSGNEPGSVGGARHGRVGLVSAEELDRLHRRIEVSIDGAAERLRSTLENSGREHGLMIEWRSVDGPAAVAVPQHARYADLCVVGRDAAVDDNSVDYRFSEELLFVTGRPILFIPAFPPSETLGRHIAVAWNSSRPAARAVNDALPLIEHSERSTVLTVNPKPYSTVVARCRQTKWSNISGATAL